MELRQPFWMGKYEVTQEEFRIVMGKEPATFTGDRNPVENVSWHEAVEFCLKLNARERAAGRMLPGYSYRLPTAVEWEYACRAGTDTAFSFGDDPKLLYIHGNYCDKSNTDGLSRQDKKHDDRFDKTAPVGSYKPNPWGLYDMHGNVGEWCLGDWTDRRLPGKGFRRLGAMGRMLFKEGEREVRGGSWNHAAPACTATSFNLTPSTLRENFIGFRVCLAPRPDRAAVPREKPRTTQQPDSSDNNRTHTAPPQPKPPPAPDPEKELEEILAAVAGHLVAGRGTTALRTWKKERERPVLKAVAEQMEAVDDQLARIASLDRLVLEALQKDVGKQTTIRLRQGSVSGKLRDATPQRIRLMVPIEGSKGAASIGRTYRFSDLSVQEKLLRLGKGSTPELNLMRGMLALGAGRPDAATSYFEKARCPLGKALVQQLRHQGNAEIREAAERAFKDLIHTLARPGKPLSPEGIVGLVRKKCGGSIEQVRELRAMLDSLPTELARSDEGRKLVPLISKALTCPWPEENWTVPGLNMEFIWLPALSCWVGKYEVTNAQVRAAKPDHRSKDYEGRSLDGDTQPAVYVNCEDAAAYAKWLTEREREAMRLPPGLAYRLPTGAEWTAFAQCGDGRIYPWGNDWPPTFGNYGEALPTRRGRKDNYVVTAPVTESGRNDWGLYGVGGNVWECTAEGGPDNPTFEAWRGASWFSREPGDLRCDHRYASRGSHRGPTYGFRLVLAR